MILKWLLQILYFFFTLLTTIYTDYQASWQGDWYYLMLITFPPPHFSTFTYFHNSFLFIFILLKLYLIHSIVKIKVHNILIWYI